MTSSTTTLLHAITATAVLGILAACSSTPTDDPTTSSSEQAAVAAAGSVPAGLPQHVLVGLQEETGLAWMSSSGVPWDSRYRYLTKGWTDNWGWGPYDGAFAADYLKESAAKGYVPALQYYQLISEPGGGEAQTLAKTQNAAVMKSYFGDFKMLMQRVKEFGKPTLVLVEADATGFLEHQSNHNPNTYAAIAASGVPELAALPNTVAGWGLAFLQMKKAVGASNVILGIHVSGWASTKDLFYAQVTDPLQPEVDQVYGFLAPFGIAGNVTGATYDVLVGDPLDRDSDYYLKVQGVSKWWDASDTASTSSASFNRYAEWLRMWNVKSNKRWVLWQIPEGNSNHLDIDNNGSARAGYKDNRPEYFFGNGTAHVAKFADAGVIGLLFGAGMTGMSTHGNDIYTDGQSFLKTRGARYYAAGGVPFGAAPPVDAGAPTDAATPRPDASTPVDASVPPDASIPPATDASRYSFESGVQGWASTGGAITGLAASTAKPFAGTRSLALTFGGTSSGSQRIYVRNPTVTAGKTITFHVWVPAGSRIVSMQPYVQQGATGGWTWTGNWQSIDAIPAGAWKTLTVAVPATAKTPLYEVGLEISTSAAWSGTAYVDAINW